MKKRTRAFLALCVGSGSAAPHAPNKQRASKISKQFCAIAMLAFMVLGLQGCFLDILKKKETDPVQQYIGIYQMSGQISCSDGSSQSTQGSVSIVKGTSNNQITVTGVYASSFNTSLSGSQFTIPTMSSTDANGRPISSSGSGTFSDNRLSIAISYTGQGYQCKINSNGSK